MARSTTAAKTIFATAWNNTSATVFRDRTSVIRSALFLILGSIIYFYWRVYTKQPDPQGDAMSEVVTYFSYVLVPGAIMLAVVFLYQLWLAPYIIMRREIGEVKGKLALIEQIAHDQMAATEGAILRLDEATKAMETRIKELFDASADEITEKAKREYSQAIGARMQLLHDEAIIRQTHSDGLERLHKEMQAKIDSLQEFEEKKFEPQFMYLVGQLSVVNGRLESLESKFTDPDSSETL